MVSHPETGARIIRLARPDVGDEELAEIREVLESGQLTMGAKVAELEELLAAAAGTAHAVAVSSGTAALHVAVLALGVGPGDEVLVPAYTFPSTANVVALAGGTPVLVDVDPVTMNIDPAAAASRVTPRTKAVLAVHLFGRPARVEELPAVTVLEDAAGRLARRRAPLRLWERSPASSFTRARSTTGEGGAAVDDDGARAERVSLAPPPRLVALRGLRRYAAAAFNYRLRTSSAHSASRSCAGRGAARGHARRSRLRRERLGRPRRRPAGYRSRRPPVSRRT